MSRLATRAEIAKLGHAFGRDPSSLQFLLGLPAEELRRFRGALDELLFSQELDLLHRAAGFARWMPDWVLVVLCRWVLGPLLTARLAGEIPAKRAARIIMRLPPAFVARAAAEVDPRRIRDLMQKMTVESVVRVAGALLESRDYLTIGHIVEFLPDDAIRAVEAAIEDEEQILRIAFFVESRNRMDHLVKLMPEDKIRAAILVLRDESRRELWPMVFALLANVSYALKRELGELAAAQGEETLAALVHAIHTEDMWTDVLPLVASLSPDTQRRLANLPVLHEPGMLEGVVRAATDDGLWGIALSLAAMMSEDLRAKVSRIADRLPAGAMKPAARAALLEERWAILLDLTQRMSSSKQAELADAIRAYGDADPTLPERLLA